MLPKEFPDITTPGDIAATGVGYALGYGLGLVLDIFFPGIGPPGTTAGVVATGFLGVKYLMQVRSKASTGERERQRLEKQKDFLINNFLNADDNDTKSDRTQLDINHALWNNDFSTHETYKMFLDDLVRKYVKRAGGEGEDTSYWHLRIRQRATFEKSGLAISVVECNSNPEVIPKSGVPAPTDSDSEGSPKEARGIVVEVGVQNSGTRPKELEARNNFAVRITETDTPPSGDAKVTKTFSPPVALLPLLAPDTVQKVTVDPGHEIRLWVIFGVPGESDSRQVSLEFSPEGREALESRSNPWDQGPIAEWDLGTVKQIVERPYLRM